MTTGGAKSLDDTHPDMARGWKLAWAILGLIPLVPFIYVLTGGDLW
jgi:hypothetical protein